MKIRYATKGFSLIEVLVSIFLFSIIVLIVGDAFIMSMKMQRTAFEFQQIQENASIALETMTKEIRVSQIAPTAESTGCPDNPDQRLQITNDSGVVIDYYVDSNGRLIRQINGSSEWSPLSSDTVRFERFGFCVTGAPDNDEKQTRVTILAQIKRGNSKIDIQTTVSLRKLGT